MNVLAVSALAVMALGTLFLLSLVPLPGVQAKTSIQVKGIEIPVELRDKANLSDNAVGRFTSYDGKPRWAKIILATDMKGFYNFLSTCSHEVKHFEMQLNNVSWDRHRSRMSDELLVAGIVPPWNFENQCYSILPERIGL